VKCWTAPLSSLFQFPRHCLMGLIIGFCASSSSGDVNLDCFLLLFYIYFFYFFKFFILCNVSQHQTAVHIVIKFSLLLLLASTPRTPALHGTCHFLVTC
jgi:hypothetical protein